MTDNDRLYVDAIQLPRTPRRERMIDVIVRNERLAMLCLDCGETTGDVGTHAVNFCVGPRAP
jgi:hypothetical protein